MNKEQENGYYRQALKMADNLYNYMVETLSSNKIVAFAVTIDRWDNYVKVRAWASAKIGAVDEETKQLIGNVSMNFDFAEWSHDIQLDFVAQFKENINQFAERANNTLSTLK